MRVVTYDRRRVIGSALAAGVLAGCGGSNTQAPSGSSTRAAAGAKRTLTSVSAASVGSLPAAVEDAAIAPLADGRLALLGGIDSSQSSTDAILTLGGGGAT